MLLHAPISIPPFRRSPLALPPQPEIRLIPLVRTGTVRTNGSHQHIPPAAIALTFRMPMPYPLKSPPLASEDEMPPPPDASLPVKPSGGERFSEILEEAEVIKNADSFGGAVGPSSGRPCSCRARKILDSGVVFRSVAHLLFC